MSIEIYQGEDKQNIRLIFKREDTGKRFNLSTVSDITLKWKGGDNGTGYIEKKLSESLPEFSKSAVDADGEAILTITAEETLTMRNIIDLNVKIEELAGQKDTISVVKGAFRMLKSGFGG